MAELNYEYYNPRRHITKSPYFMSKVLILKSMKKEEPLKVLENIVRTIYSNYQIDENIELYKGSINIALDQYNKSQKTPQDLFYSLMNSFKELSIEFHRQVEKNQDDNFETRDITRDPRDDDIDYSGLDGWLDY